MNMEIGILEDFQKWKELNKEIDFSLFDYVFQMKDLSKLHSDIFFGFYELCWPSFLTYKNYVFLKETFSKQKFDSLILEDKKVEFWMNFLSIDPYFETEVQAECFAKKLVESWTQKLRRDFPDKHFVVQYLCDEDTGDHGVTFYQEIR